MCDSCTLPKKKVLNNARTGPIVGGAVEEINSGKDSKRKCGCLRTSEKLKKILGTFPATAPPQMTECMFDKASGYNYGQISKNVMPPMVPDCCRQGRVVSKVPTGLTAQPVYSDHVFLGEFRKADLEPPPSKSWQVVTELVALVQLSVTATALALYYLIYCYMHLIYFTLRSAMYFHNADGPMKVTIAVVTVTSIVIGLHILTRMQKIIGVFY